MPQRHRLVRAACLVVMTLFSTVSAAPLAQFDCAQLTNACVFNATTASCVFASSATFGCGVQAPAWDCRWELTGDLVLADNVTIDILGDDCALRLSANMLVLGANATLRAPSVSVDAAFVRLGWNAQVAALYGGRQFRSVSSLFPGNATHGASFGGSGGRRHPAVSASSYFDVRPQGDLAVRAAAAWDLESLWANETDVDAAMWLLGSGSLTASAGGRVRVVASRDLVLSPRAAIRANGGAATDETASGGSGGSVYLSATALSLGTESTVEAKGGNAFCDANFHCAPGGGGGRVHIAYVSSQLDDRAVDVRGGRSVDKAYGGLAGAAGTYLRVFGVATATPAPAPVETPGSTPNASVWATMALHNEETTATSEAMMMISNYRLETHEDSAVTPLVMDASHRRIDCLVVTDGAAVATHGLAMAHGDLTLTNASVLVDDNTTTRDIVVTARHVVLSDHARVVLRSQSLTLDASTLVVDESVAVAFTQRVLLSAGTTLRVDATIQSLQGTLAIVGGQDVAIGGAGVSVGALYVHADGSIAVTATALDAAAPASIDARFQTCDPLRGKQSDPASFVAWATSANFTLLLEAAESIAIDGPKPSNVTMFDVATSTPAVLETETPEAAAPPPPPPVALTGSAILVCAEDLITLGDAATVSSTGRGEQANQGPGSGDCVGSVGGGGGYGGRGADSSGVNAIGDFATGGLAYGTRSGAGMLGSGGGCVDGGAGGGIVLLGARGVVLNGHVSCNGNGGTQSGGGGAGGFLGLSIADFLKGHGRISAVGGGAQCVDVGGGETNTTLVRRLTAETADIAETVASAANPSIVCGGGGGGGRLQLRGCDRNDVDQCTRGFDGNYTVAGGATSLVLAPDVDAASPKDSSVSIRPAEYGSFVGFPCLPGSGGLFCRVCLPGTYKTESNSEECRPCTNAPANAHYDGFGATSLATCDWTCNPGYSGDACVSPLQQLLDACGGVLGFGVVLLSIVVFLILLGYACRTRKEPRHRGAAHTMDGVAATTSERQHLLRAAIASTQRSRFACLLRWLYWPRVGYPKLVERDLPEHMARIYFSGLNDRDAPLRLRLTVPPPLKSVLYDDEYRILAERINAALAWPTGALGSWGEFVYGLVALVCYPAASAVLAYRRHLRLNALKRIVGRYNHACMKGPRARGLLNALKLGYSGDYSLVYLELLYKESSQSACVPTTAIGKPALPIVLLFAGRGTYESPFYLDPSDLLVRSIPQCPELTAFIDEPWVEFVAELNALLRVVCNKDVALVETLLPVAQFLEAKMAAVTTSSSSKLGGLRIYLGRFYVGDDVDCGDEFKLGILVTTARNESRNNDAATTTNPPSNPRGLIASTYGTNGLPTLESYGRATEDALLSYDPVSGGWSYTVNGPGSQRGGVRRGSSTNNNSTTNSNAKSSVSSIREEALRIRSNTSGSIDSNLVHLGDFDSPMHGPRSGRAGPIREPRRRKRRQTFYEGWLGPVDGSLPVPGVLISADELEDRLADRTPQQKLEWLVRKHLVPTNVPPSKWLGASWMVHGALLSLLMVDLAITFAMVVNLRCVTNGEVDKECSAAILIPVLLLPPLTLFLAPIMGIVSLAIASNAFSRRYAIWNALSMASVGVAIVVCLTQSSRLVAPWFTAPLPLLPVIAMAVKAGEAYVVERYIAFQETNRRRRGWRGLMKRRLSDASLPVESPYSSPVSSDSTPSYLTTTTSTFR